MFERAFSDSSENYEGLSKDAFRAAVLQRALFGISDEGHRWFDLVRTGTFIKRMKDTAHTKRKSLRRIKNGHC